MKIATLCYIRSEEKILMMYRGSNPGDIHAGKWNGLGGKLEEGEDPDSGVCREVKEECGLEIVKPRLAGVLTFPYFKDGESWYVFVYVATEFSGELVAYSPEGRVEWIDEAKLFDLPLWKGDKVFLPLVLKGQFFSGSFFYVEKELAASRCLVYESAPGEIVTCIE